MRGEGRAACGLISLSDLDYISLCGLLTFTQELAELSGSYEHNTDKGNAPTLCIRGRQCVIICTSLQSITNCEKVGEQKCFLTDVLADS